MATNYSILGGDILKTSNFASNTKFTTETDYYTAEIYYDTKQENSHITFTAKEGYIFPICDTQLWLTGNPSSWSEDTRRITTTERQKTITFNNNNLNPSSFGGRQSNFANFQIRAYGTDSATTWPTEDTEEATVTIDSSGLAQATLTYTPNPIPINTETTLTITPTTGYILKVRLF